MKGFPRGSFKREARIGRFEILEGCFLGAFRGGLDLEKLNQRSRCARLKKRGHELREHYAWVFCLDSHPVSHLVNSLEVSTMRAAIKLSVTLDAVSYDSTPTMQAGRSKGLDGTFEAVERIAPSLHDNIKTLVVVIVAYLANSHSGSPVGGCPCTLCGLVVDAYEMA